MHRLRSLALARHRSRPDGGGADARPRPSRPRRGMVAGRGAADERGGAVEPALHQFGMLKAALARYRALAVQEGFVTLREVGASHTGRRVPGVRGRRGAPVRAGRPRCGRGGRRDPDTPALGAAVRRFQERHGLSADGVLGRSTVRELNVAPAARARQIELALERLRWLPRPGRAGRLRDRRARMDARARRGRDERPHTQYRHLARPVSVCVFYTTAIVRADGALSFFDDVYGEDRDLERALARRP